MAYEQWQQTPQGLQTLFNLPVQAQPAAMHLLEQQQNADDLTGRDQQRQFDYNTQMDPLRVSQLGLANQTAQAHLPGIQAQSSMLQRKNSNEELLNPEMIKDLKGKYSSAELQRHLSDVEGIGTAALQHSQMALSNPLGAAQRWKDYLKKIGHEDMYNPAWDNELDPTALSFNLQQMGEGIQGSSSKMRQALDLANMKYNTMMAVQDKKSATSEKNAALLAQAKQAVADAKAAAGKDPKTLEALATRLLAAAQGTGDPEMKQYFLDQYQQTLGDLKTVKAAGTIATQSGAVDLGSLKEGELRQRGGAQVESAIRGGAPAPMAPPMPAPQAAPSAAPKGLPPPPAGRVYMKNVKTGQVGHVPEGQMEDAMKQGYELVR